MERIGIFLCYCPLGPLGSQAIKQVREALSQYFGVVHATEYENICLGLGLEKIENTILETKLDGVVLTSCSPSLHQEFFREAITSAGLKPHQFEVANLKPSPPTNGGITVEEAIEIIKKSIDRLRLRQIPVSVEAPIIKRALVIGGGIVGIQAALDIADAGYKVILVEKNPSIGGHMIQLSEVFPTLDCPQCIMTPKMADVGSHPNIELMTYSEVEEVSGYIGNFKVKIKKKARYIDEMKCTGCGSCEEKCPWKVDSEFNIGLSKRKVIYRPFPQAVPAIPVIDKENCVYFKKGTCRACEKFCEAKAIDFNQQDKLIEAEVGAIILATGFELLPKEKIPEYIDDPDILHGLQFERILCPSGPTTGVVVRPSDGKTPKEVVFISCVGSRNPEHGVPYCSRVCCMYLVKQAMLYKHAVPDGQAYIFYIDVRTTGKGYEEFVQRAVEEGVLYLRGRVSKIFREGDKLKVWGVDTLTGNRVEISCDLVVLGLAMLPSPGIKELAQKLGILTDEHSFITESHPKLRPLETPLSGIYVAGTAQGPKDIPDSVAQASGAASKVLALFSKAGLMVERVATA